MAGERDPGDLVAGGAAGIGSRYRRLSNCYCIPLQLLAILIIYSWRGGQRGSFKIWLRSGEQARV